MVINEQGTTATFTDVAVEVEFHRAEPDVGIMYGGIEMSVSMKTVMPDGQAITVSADLVADESEKDGTKLKVDALQTFFHVGDDTHHAAESRDLLIHDGGIRPLQVKDLPALMQEAAVKEWNDIQARLEGDV